MPRSASPRISRSCAAARIRAPMCIRRAAYGRLCRLLTRGKRGDDIERIEKGECHLKLDDLLEFCEGQLLVAMLPHRFEMASVLKVLERLKESRVDGVWLAAS